MTTREPTGAAKSAFEGCQQNNYEALKSFHPNKSPGEEGILPTLLQNGVELQKPGKDTGRIDQK